MSSLDVAIAEFAALNEFSKPSAELLSIILLSDGVKLSLQLRSLYFCRDLSSSQCAEILKRALNVHYDAFLRHEIAYVLGQASCKEASDVLIALLENENEDPMVRHEAGEALAAIGGKDFIEVIEKYKDDKCVVVRDTCRLALHSLLNDGTSDDDNAENIPICSCVCAPISTSAYRAIDPVPCSTTELSDESLSALNAVMCDESLPLYKRYEALFKIRNAGGDAAASLIGDALLSDKVSEVFRHECAFVLGQMQSMAASRALLQCLMNANEEPIARHEAALALGSCAAACPNAKDREDIINALTAHKIDAVKVVADSCIVALDVISESASPIHAN
ncbi:Deoxyhypusine hydroxylase [Babesia sp. Xinjiang]|uniref:Deoxyhypusine hydroxylase n=1 Tax=Babesia sp. Xinjiang TaxID=462227 RepID=UPI000A2454B9|nr:Deoxyhypusine hydroxylase [Babesia sp. Xinjiang]ORM39423.1 Deoxyhypusine hydroxylase [Babesia sp. Xinjiang]